MRKQNAGGFKIPVRIKKKLDNEKWLKKEFAKGKNAQEILEISDEEIDDIYDAACYFFEKEKFTDAARTYLFLVTLNPRIHEFWLGLAMSTQMCGDYEGALEAYEMAGLKEIDSPIPYFYLARCLLALNDIENAVFALELTIELAGEDVEFEEIKNQSLEGIHSLLNRS